MATTLQKSKNHLALYFLLILTLLVGCFVVEGHSYFDGSRQADMTNVQMFISVGGYALLLTAFFLLLRHYYPVEKTWWPIAFFGVAFLVDLIAIWFFPGVYDTGELIYQLDVVTELRYSAYALVVFSLLYLLFAIVPAITAGSKIYDLILLIAVVIVFTSVVFSYISEANLYQAILKNGGPDDTLQIPTSWTNHKNVYAFVLFNGMVAEAILEAKCPHAWRWGLILFFYLNQFFVLSKTGLAAATLFMLGFYLWHFVKTLKKNKLRNWIILGVLLGGLVIFLLIGFLNPKALWLNRFLRNTWDYMIASISATLMDRIYVWSDVVRCIFSFPLTLFCGVGYGNWNHVFYAYLLGDPNGFYPVDSSWITDLARAGIFGVVFCALLDLYVVYIIVDAIRHKSKIGVVSALYGVGLFLRSFVESGDLANPDSFGMIYMALLVLPLLSERYARLHPEIEKARIDEILDPNDLSLPRQPFTSSRFIPKFLSLVCPFFVMIAFALLSIGIVTNNGFLMSSDFYYSFMSVALFFPYFLLGMVFLLRQHHFYGFLTLAFWSVADLALALYLPSIGAGWLGVLFPVLMGFVLFLVVVFSGIVPFENQMAKYPLIYTGAGLALLFFGHLIIETNPLSVYLSLALLGFAVTLYVFLACLPFSITDSWFLERWEKRILRLGNRYALKSEEAYWRVYHQEGKS